jgi:hypothetical protein
MTVTIPKPCDHNWQTFTPTKHGGFCSSCNKEVIDFTNWKPEEIHAYFLKRPHGSCGKLRASQLRDFSAVVTLNMSSLMRWITPPLVSMSLSLAPTVAIAQPGHDVEFSIPASISNEETSADQTLKTNIPRKITGVVIDPVGQPMPGVNVYLKGTTNGTVTDADGNYELMIQRPTTSDVLAFSFIGMITEEVLIGNQESIEVTLKYDEALLSEQIIVGGVCTHRRYSPRSMWYKIKGLFRRRHSV